MVVAVGTVCFGCALWAVWRMRETHSQDLDYIEQLP